MSLGVKKKYNHTNKKIYIKYVKYLYLFLNYKKIPIQSSFNSQIKTWPKLDLKRKKKVGKYSQSSLNFKCPGNIERA